MALSVLAGHCDKEQRDGDVLKLEPVKECESGCGARPVQQLPQLEQEWDGLEHVERHCAKVVDVPGEHKGMPPAPPSVPQHHKL